MNPTFYLHVLFYLKARLAEASTWVSIGASIAAVSMLAPPWSYLGLACGIMAAMVPNRSGDPK